MPDWIRFLPLHSVMIHNISKEASWAINPVYWTLPIEFSFYLVLPFIASVLARAERQGGSRRWRILSFVVLAMLALSWSYRFLMFHVYSLSGVGTLVWAMNQIPGTIDQFVLGGATATALRWARPQIDAWTGRFRARMATALAVVGLLGIVGMMYFLDDIFEIFWSGHWAMFVWYSITSGFIAALLAGIAISSGFTRGLFANRIVVFIGTISYSIYLWHYPIALWIWQAYPATTAHGLPGFLLVTMPVIVLVSAASYFFVERPFLRSYPRKPILGGYRYTSSTMN